MPRRAAFALLAVPALAGAALPPATADLTVDVSGMRNAKGEVQLCVTRANDFLKCEDDPQAVTAEMETARVAPVTFENLPVGTYTVLVLHDENANGKMDTMLGIPKEGFGFSGNPAIRMGPPKAASVRFHLTGDRDQRIKLKYLL